MGANRWRWNCDRKGCYSKQKVKLGVFDDCFPGKIGMGDVDGVVHQHGRFLYLEWKPVPLIWNEHDGQYQALKWRTYDGRSEVICVAGNAELMTVSHMAFFRAGEFTGWAEATLEDVKNAMRQWYDWACFQSYKVT